VPSFDLSTSFVHLGLGAKATVVEDFEWSASFLEAYERRFEADGAEGRLVCITPQDSTWTTWERHLGGEELVVLLSGRIDLIQLIDGEEVVTSMLPGQAIVNPVGVWHRSVVHEPGAGLFITPGKGTEHRPV
jgi:hypothetical protein